MVFPPFLNEIDEIRVYIGVGMADGSGKLEGKSGELRQKSLCY